MADEKNNSDFVCVDTASSTDGCPTPSTTMSEDMPIREKKDDALKNEEDTVDSKLDKSKRGGKCKEDSTKAKENKSPSSDHAKAKETKPSEDNYARHIEHLPTFGDIFIIRARQEPRRTLGLLCGKLKLLDNPMPASGIFWYCCENGNWCGFRNLTSGTFLGHNGAGKILATQNCQRVEEYFIPIRHESGGYILHTFHPEKRELLQVAIAEDENEISLVEKKKGGTAWDFISAEYVRYSLSLVCPNMEEESLVKRM